jgi:hypothetical protein
MHVLKVRIKYMLYNMYEDDDKHIQLTTMKVSNNTVRIRHVITVHYAI